MTKVPLSASHDLRQRINAQLEDFWKKIGTHHTGVSGRAHSEVPAETDLSAGAEGLRIEIELPGMDESDIEVSVRDRVLSVSGEKRVEREVSERTYHLSERAFGRFERRFALPKSLDAEKIAASYGDGVLTIAVPPSEETGPAAKKIKIESR